MGFSAPRSLLVATCLLAAACGDDGGAQPDAPVDGPPTGTATVRVDHYAYQLNLDTQASSIALSLVLTSDGNCVTLPSRATQLDLGSAMLGGAPAAATADGTTFTACGAGWPRDTPLELSVRGTQPLETWASTDVGFSINLDGANPPNRYFYLVSWVGGCDRFGPCDTNPATFARYDFTVQHATGVSVLCSGRITAGTNETTCSFDHDGGPTYSTFGLIASTAWVTTELGDWDGVRATLHERTGASMPVGSAVDMPNHSGFLAWMSDEFGPYPYGDELRIVVAPTYWSGFEHPGNIVLDSGLTRGMSSYARPVTHVLNHEIAHQWAGDETTLASTYDFVWKEAMAEYLSFVYEDMVEPANALVTARAWKSFAQGAAYHPVPEDATRPTLLQYYGEVYGPGPMILFRQLEALRSRPVVFTALRDLLGEQRAIGVDDVQTALEAAAGVDLDQYFDVWVRGAGAPVWPTFRVEVTGVAPDQAVVVTETTPGGVLHGCAFAVEVRGGNGERAKVRIDRGVNGIATLTVPTGVAWTATSTVLDPDAECLAFSTAAAAAPAPRHPPGWTPWRGSLSASP